MKKKLNRKGFTLIELLITVALLSVISIISFVSINAMIEKNKINECETLVNNIKIATKEYVSDHRYDKNFDLNDLTATTLIEKNYLTGPLYNPFTKEAVNSGSIRISVTSNSNYIATNIDVKYNGIIINCENKEW